MSSTAIKPVSSIIWTTRVLHHVTVDYPVCGLKILVIRPTNELCASGSETVSYSRCSAPSFVISRIVSRSSVSSRSISSPTTVPEVVTNIACASTSNATVNKCEISLSYGCSCTAAMMWSFNNCPAHKREQVPPRPNWWSPLYRSPSETSYLSMFRRLTGVRSVARRPILPLGR